MGGGIAFGISGSASASATLYADDLVSADLYEGTQNSITITNDIDLSTEGGWIARVPRNSGGTNYGWTISDTNNGVQKRFWPSPPGTNGLATQTDSITAFNTDGYTFGGNLYENESGIKHVGHTFRQAPGFCDVVSWTGTGSAQTIPHNLGSAPGAIFVKRTNTTGSWYVYHRSLGATQNLVWNTEASVNTSSIYWNDTEPTSTEFTVGTSAGVNGLDDTYVAYLFAHDDQVFGENSDESVVYCGSFEKSSSGASIEEISLPWEPGIVYVKCADQSSGEQAYWYILDYMRGFSVYHHANIHTNNHSSSFRNEENKNYVGWYPRSDGFVFNSNSNGSYQNMVGTMTYIAFRRPGHRPPASAADVFKVHIQSTGSSAPGLINYGFSPDLVLFKKYNSNSNNNLPIWVDRVRGQEKRLDSTSKSPQYDDTGALEFDRQTGISIDSDAISLYSNGFSYRHYAWKRAAKFFDSVFWIGTGATRTIPHSLQVKPEMIIVKNLAYNVNGGVNWIVWHKDIGDSLLNLNTSDAWINSGPSSGYGGTGVGTATGADFYTNSTDSVIGVNSAFPVNGNGQPYISYLFASLDGVSKVGSYTGQASGSYVADTLGFTPKFIMIKAADRAGDWNVFDVERGLTVGGTSAVAVALNTTDNETQTGETDAIRATTTGFTVNTGSASTDINENGKKYLYYAVA